MTTEPIIRVFRAVVHSGQEAAFADFFLNEALPLVKRQDGLLAVQVGLPLRDGEREFLMVTTWRDTDALKGFAGERWSEAVVDPRERPFLSRTSVTHYGDAQV